MNVNEFAAALESKFRKDDKYDHMGLLNVTVTKGRRYAKVWTQRGTDRYTKFIHCFVEVETGHVFKAAGINAPAAGVRFATMPEAVKAADVHGRYLYL